MARSRSAAFSLRVSASLCSSVTTCPVLAERNAAPATPAAASSAENPPAYTTMAPASGMAPPYRVRRRGLAALPDRALVAVLLQDRGPPHVAGHVVAVVILPV